MGQKHIQMVRYILEIFFSERKMAKVIFSILFKLGIYHMNDGSIYEGEFKDDKIEGYGRIAWKQDKQYEGQWSNNSLNGFGVFLNKGKYYVGKIKFNYSTRPFC